MLLARSAILLVASDIVTKLCRTESSVNKIQPHPYIHLRREEHLPTGSLVLCRQVSVARQVVV
jgi:hypothetical protein